MATIQRHTPLIASHGNDIDPWPRYITAVGGAWLFLSAFLWTHQSLQRTNAWVVGALIFTAAISAIGVPKMRFANTILAVWLFVSALFLDAYTYTAWNNAIVAACVFAFSLVPNGHNGPLVPRRTR